MIIVHPKTSYAVDLELVQGDAFYTSLVICRTMSVRDYNPNTKVWSIPMVDMPELIRRCKHHRVEIKVSDAIKRAFTSHAHWRLDQKKLSKNMNGLDDGSNPFPVSELFPFQIVGAQLAYQAVTESRGAMICDPVGLGKTIQAIAVCERLSKEKITNFTIIVCPSTLKRNWEIELDKFTDKDVLLIQGGQSKRIKQYKSAYKFDYMIINFELLVNDLQYIEKRILNRGFNFALIVDEAQYIKNGDTKRTIATKRVSEFSQASIGLSATALETKITDLFHGFQIIHPYILGKNQQAFASHYCELDYFGSVTGYKNVNEMRSRFRPYVIRRFKEDVLDQLPERIENNLWVDLHPQQMKLYKEMQLNIGEQIDDMEKKQKIEMASILPMITYLRQVCLSTKIVGHSENISTKTDVFMEFLESLDERVKIVVFCHFTGMIELLHATLTKKGIPHVAIHGGGGSVGHTSLACPVHKRIDVIDRWQADPEQRVLVTSDILTEGVNIPAASYIVNFDMLFNPAKMEQRIGRLDRLNQKHSHINIINLIARNTLEEEIYETVLSRRDMFTAVMDGGKVENRLRYNNIKSLIGLK